MKRAELKRLIKPLIKECLGEVLLESGVLSTVISEVVVGLSQTQPLVESARPQQPQAPALPDTSAQTRQLRETRKKMLEAVGRDAYGGVDVFEGTKPLKSGGSPGSSPSPASPLAGRDPSDAGVDITTLMPGMADVWKKLM